MHPSGEFGHFRIPKGRSTANPVRWSCTRVSNFHFVAGLLSRPLAVESTAEPVGRLFSRFPGTAAQAPSAFQKLHTHAAFGDIALPLVSGPHVGRI